jgi:hypothetical protein
MCTKFCVTTVGVRFDLHFLDERDRRRVQGEHVQILSHRIRALGCRKCALSCAELFVQGLVLIVLLVAEACRVMYSMKGCVLCKVHSASVYKVAFQHYSVTTRTIKTTQPDTS